jgi:hypothetical protein
MRNFLAIALLFIASTLAFGQDGRTKVNFVNQTGDTLRFFLNTRPACSGDVMPGGFCTESVNPGSYVATASNGQQTTGGQAFDIAYGETYTYRVYVEQTATPVPYGLKRAGYKTVANLDYHMGFTVDVPITLTTDGPKAGVTNQGKPYTQSIYMGVLANDDTYMVGVSDYTFALSNEDLARGLEGFRAGLTKGTVTKQESLTVSGQPALMAFVDSEVNGRTLRFALLITYKGNKAVFFTFGTWLDSQGTDLEAVKTFFKSAALN